MKLLLKAACFMALLCVTAPAEVINYQGRLSLNGTPFNGMNRFKFALIGDQGTAVWSSQEITLQVNDGVYAVRLGDSAQAAPISNAVFQGNPPKLRIWFDRKEKGWARVGNDVTVSSETAPPAATAGGEGNAILAELREIHTLLASQQKGGSPAPEPPQIVTVSIADAPSLGQPDAPLVLVEFTDFQCPFCARFQNEVFGLLKTNFVDTGKLRVVSHNLPLPFHAFAAPAARAAICADAQGKFWLMRERFFAVTNSLSDEIIGQVVQNLGLDAAKYATCATNQATANTLLQDSADAKAATIEATPSFVLGRAVAGKVTGLKIVGAQPYANFAAEINKQLAAGGGH